MQLSKLARYIGLFAELRQNGQALKDYPKPGESQLEEMRYFLTEVVIVRKKILNCASALEFDGDHYKDKTKIDPIKTEAQGVRDEYKTKLDGMHLEGKKYCSKYSPAKI